MLSTMSKTLSSLSVQQLLAAAKLKEKIHSLEKKLEGILGSSGESAASPAPKKKFKMSAAACTVWGCLNTLFLKQEQHTIGSIKCQWNLAMS